MFDKLQGLVAATHTPFHADGSLDLSGVERQAAHLTRAGVKAAFIAGTTGESHSLTLEERQALALRWSEVIPGTGLRLVVHVGSNCLSDARALAAHAQKVGASAVAALSPSYFKPPSLDALVAWCADIAADAPGLPFYFYDIPGMTGVSLSMPDFLETARIPTLAGLKFTNPDLMAYQRCLHAAGGRFDIPWGLDEFLLAALALGATGAVGSTYNLAAPLYRRVIDAFGRADMAAARADQFRSVQLVDLLIGFGFIGAAKAVMGMLGTPVGPARPPHVNPTGERLAALRAGLERIGFFEWAGP